MNKRQFLKSSGVLLGGSMLARLGAGAEQAEARKNWAGNLTYQAGRLHEPRTVEEVQALVRGALKVKALGSRHSFNRIADSPESQISLRHFDQIELDPKSRTVTTAAGVTYGQLALFLESKGYALHNLASLPHISVAGACATATHGSGMKNGNLATAVSSLELVTGTGDVVRLSREKDGERFQGAVVGLGALGVVTRVTLDVQPTFKVRQLVYLDLPTRQLENHLPEIFSAGYSVSLFTDWQQERVNQVWIKRRVDQEESSEVAPEFFGARLATRKMHPLAEMPPENCTEQQGIAGPWYDRLPHFRIGFTPSAGNELQAEYFVPLSKAYEAIRAVETLRDQLAPVLMISELRTIDADKLWMSTAYHQPSLAIHFTWKPDGPNVQKVLPLIEAKLKPFGAKPHWGKLFTMPPGELRSRYERLADFRKLAEELDPKGKFRNEFLNTLVLAS
jgi:xylitol oxidase